MGVVTVRLPQDMHEAMRIAAEKNATSMNEIMCTLAERYLKEQQEIELYEAFGLLGENPEEASVEFAFAAQSQVVLADE